MASSGPRRPFRPPTRGIRCSLGRAATPELWEVLAAARHSTSRSHSTLSSRVAMESKHSREDETPERKPSLSRKSTADDDCEAPAPAPEVVALRQGYNQTYVVRSGGGKDNSLHDVLFRCGNWCYGGQVDLGGSRLELADVPVAIPALQKQQASLQYLGEWKALPTTSPYSAPLATLYDALDFMGAELASSRIEHKLMTAADEHAWIDADPKGSGSGSSHFFELQTSGFSSLDDSGIDFAASKTFVRGLVLLVVYYQRSFYVVLQDGDGEQPLLDVRFPDMSTHLQGVHLQTYHQEDGSKRGTEDIAARVKKLTLWQAGDGASGSGGKIASPSKPLKVQCKDVSGGGGYTQTFLIRRSSSADKTNNLREVLFRFGNWCYNGHVDLGPKLELADIPVIIPMLRRQQSALTFMCEVGKMPATSLFTPSMEHLAELVPALQGEISKAEQFVRALASSKDAGAAARVTEWLEDDDTECFFEIGVDKCPALQNVEAIASKVYLGGVVLVVLYYDYTFYVYLENGEEEQPLLDTTFPDISFQKEGMQLKTYRGGVPGCPELRRLSIWKVVLDMMDDSDGEEGGVRVSNASLAASGKGSSDRLRADSKQMERRREEDVKSPGEDGNKPTNNSSPSKPEARKTALPHHIAPLKQPNASGSATLKKIPDLGLKAPWDETGRPLGLRASK